jgi:Rrf2 family protein
MKLTTRGRYATRIMVYLAARGGDRPARKQEIARAEGISPDYVEQILMKLRTAGLIVSRRGIHGGFDLARDAGAITVADVLGATEGPLLIAPCELDRCERASQCVTRRVWREASAALGNVFGGATIGNLAEEARAIRRDQPVSFQI